MTQTIFPLYFIDNSCFFRIIVERLPYPLMGGWKTKFLKSFFLPLSSDYIKCVKLHDIEVTIVANKRWTGIVSEVRHYYLSNILKLNIRGK